MTTRNRPHCPTEWGRPKPCARPFFPRLFPFAIDETQTSFARRLVGAAQQGNPPFEILLTAQAHGHPAGCGQHVMSFSLSGHDELAANRGWKGDIDEHVAVDVAQLAPAHAELAPAEPMRVHLDTSPFGDLALDSSASVD